VQARGATWVVVAIVGGILLAAAVFRSFVPAPETPQQGARRLFAELVRDGSEGPYDEHAAAGPPQAALVGYSSVPAQWIIEDDWRVPDGRLFESMRRGTATTDFYIVPILQDGRAVSEFDMQLDGGRWDLGACLAEKAPAGFFHDIEDAQTKLHAELGAGTRTRVALLLPSGLFFVVGDNGTREAAVYLIYSHAMPNWGGCRGQLPETGTLFGADELRRILTPSAPSSDDT
jgi:hypothetical protein